MSEKQAATDRGSYRAAVIRTDGTSTYWTLEGVTAEQAADNVRKRANAADAEAPVLIATVCRTGTYSPRRVTLPAAGQTTIHWAACGEYNMTAIDERIYAIDADGEPYVDLLDGQGER